MQEFNAGTEFQEPLKQVSTYDIVLAFRKRKMLYLSLAAITGLITFFILKFHILSYESTTTFYLSDPSSGNNGAVSSELKPLDIIKPSEQYNKVYQLVTSYKVQEHLIRKFNLAKHYGIDTTGEFYLEKTMHELKKNILVRRTPFNSIAVSVNDRHRYLAADLANELLRFTDQLNQELTMEHLKKRLTIFQKVMSDVKVENLVRSQQLDSLLKEVNALTLKLENRTTNASAMLNIQSRLSKVMSSLESSSDDLTRLIRYYSLAEHTLEENELPSIVIVEKALPNYRSNVIKAVVVSGLCSFLVLVLGLFREYIQLRYLRYIRLLIS